MARYFDDDGSVAHGARMSHAIFIDARVPDLAILLRGEANGAQTHVLAPDRDGLDQIADILAAQGVRELGALSIMAHGTPGALHLGHTPVDAEALPGSASTLQRIGASLGRGGSVLLYACDVARGASGARFVADLSEHLGVPVAAASHPVGAPALGGSWELDWRTRDALPPVPFAQDALAAFGALLNGGDGGAGGGGTIEGAGGADNPLGTGGTGGSGTTSVTGGSGGGGGGAGLPGGDGGTGGSDTVNSGGTAGTGGPAAGNDGVDGGSVVGDAGGGGGGGGAHGSLAGTIPGAVLGGAGGTGGSSSGSGGGGGGGAGGFGAVLTAAVIAGTTSGTIAGGAGGAGGSSAGSGNGGAGGSGGNGLHFTVSGNSVTIDHAVSGGDGGAGGASAAGVGGDGGNGGLGVVAGLSTFTVNAAITGGAGGAAGLGGAASGTAGQGGAGLVGNGVTLTIGAAGSIAGGSGAESLVLQGGANVLSFTTGGVAALTGNIFVALGASLTFDQSGVDKTIANIIAGAGSIAKAGTANVTLTAVNSYGGTTTVTAGQLTAAVAGALGATTTGVTVDGGTLDLGGAAHTKDTLTLSLGTVQNGTLNLTTGVTQSGGTFAATTTTASYDQSNGTMSGTASAATYDHSGGLLSGTANVTTYNLTNAAATSTGGTINASGAFNLQPAAGTATVAGQLTGAGNLAKTGAGTVILNGANGYTGNTSITAGTLQLAGLGTLGSVLNATTINGATAVLDLGGTSQTQNGGVVLQGGGTIQNGTLSSSGTFDMQAGNVSATLAGTGAVSKTTAGTVTFSGSNSYTGNTSITAGALQLAGLGTLGSILTATTIDGATAVLNLGGTIQTQSGGVSLQNGGTLTNGTLNGTAITSTGGTVSDINGSASLTANGGTTTVGGTNGYSGATAVNGGTLLVNGSILSATTVNATGTLGGFGTISNAVIVASGGTLAPGASAGILTTGSVNFGAGATFSIELGGTTVGSGYDQLVANGNVGLAGATLAGALISGFNPAVGDQFTVIQTVGGTISGQFASGTSAHVGGRAFEVDYSDPTRVTLSLGALKISGSDPVNVLADVNTTTLDATNSTSPIQSVERTQSFAADISATVNSGITVDGFGLALTTTKPGGAITVINDGSIVADAAAATALLLTGDGFNLVQNAGAISGTIGVETAGGTTTLEISGSVTGTGGTAVAFGITSSNNTVDLKPGASVTGSLAGSGNDDAVRLSGTAGSGTFDLSQIGSGFSQFVKAQAATWTVTGTLSDPSVDTLVHNGVLLVDGTLGNVIVTGGFGDPELPVLGGGGTVANVLVQANGILAPGASAGTLTSIGNVTFSVGSTFRVEIGGTGAGTQYDVLHLSGSTTVGLLELGGATLDVSLIGGFTPTLGQVFEIIENDDTDLVSGTFAGLGEGAILFAGGNTLRVSYLGGDGNDVTLTAISAGPGAPSLTGFGPVAEIEQAGPAATPQVLDADVSFADPEGNFNGGTLTLAGVLAEDAVAVLSLGFDPGEFLVDEQGAVDDLYFEGVQIGTVAGGAGTALNVTFNGNATNAIIEQLIENLTYLNTSTDPTFLRTLSLTVTDASAASTGAQPLTVKVFNGTIESGTAGNDSFTALPGNERIDAGLGIDTVTFGFRLVDATVTYQGNTVTIDGPSSHTVLTGFERFVFSDGTVDNNDGNWLVDDLFYYARNHDVWNAHADADAHYDANGWHEGRDPNAFFSTGIYLTANPDVQAAGVNPLTHFHQSGWREGRVPSLDFDPRQYLAANPDVKAAQVDPLEHFLSNGAQELRVPFAPTELIALNGFDFVYYLAHNPDVAAAGVDPFLHFQLFGWKEGRNPNALFDTAGYLATYGDVAAAHVDPLEHYNLFGWHEGRDPSVGFDTTSYLAAYPDVAAAHVNPLTHFLQTGIHEGRSPFADGVWG